MLKLAASRDSLRVVGDQRGTPTPSSLVAEITKIYIQRWLAQPSTACELFHLSGGGDPAATTWHGLAQKTLEIAKNSEFQLLCKPSDVAAITTADYPTPARRPANSVMCTHKLEAWLGAPLPHWQHGLTQYVKALKI